MKTLLVFAAAGSVLACAATAMAQPASLSFHQLEYQQPRDPLLPSDQSTDITEHSSQAQLAPVVATLDKAIPAGTTRATAEAVLQHAGAHCRSVTGSVEKCSYNDAETRDEYLDAVRWNVSLSLDHDRVTGIAVDRSWVRS